MTGWTRAATASLPKYAPKCSALGPVPEEGAERERWTERAGDIAAYREATGWDNADVPLGRYPASTPRKAPRVAPYRECRRDARRPPSRSRAVRRPAAR